MPRSYRDKNPSTTTLTNPFMNSVFHSTSALILASVASVAAQPTQIQIHPTGTIGQISVDFVVPAGQANGKVQYGFGGSSNTIPTSNFAYPEIGQLHQAVFSFAGAQAGQNAWYMVTGDGSTWSSNFSVVPVVSMPRFAGEYRNRCYCTLF